MDSVKRRRQDIVSWAHSKVPSLESFTSLLKFLVEKKFIILFVLAALVLLFFFWAYIKTLVVMVFFIILAAFSMIYNRWIKVSVGVEFIMLGLVVTSVVFGRLPGLIVGLVGLFLAEVISERFTYSTFVSFIGIAVVGLTAPNVFHWMDGSVTATGIIMTLLYNAIIIPGYLLLGSNLGRSALFVVTHIIFNVWVFSFIAPLLVRILM
ncbi:hypothetical protein HYV83_01740 [Candidatus Woesearchaeota archaeon]|nr:hypothetical protein [Candidatus Woesearchaeota archaeon]